MNYRSLFITLFLLSLPCMSTMHAAAALLDPQLQKEETIAKLAQTKLATVITKLTEATWKQGMQELVNIDGLTRIDGVSRDASIIVAAKDHPPQKGLYIRCDYSYSYRYYESYKEKIRFYPAIKDSSYYYGRDRYRAGYDSMDLSEAQAIIEGLSQQDREAAIESLKSYAEGIKSAVDAKLAVIDTAKTAVNGVFSFAGNQISNYAQTYQETHRAAAMAAINDRSTRNTLMTYFKVLTNPKTIGALICGIGGVVALSTLGYKLSTTLGDQFDKFINKPKLIKETTRPENIKEIILGKEMEESRIDEFVAPAGLKKDTEDIILQTQLALENGDPFTNVLLYGPPGTGKTMFAKSLARASGLDYAMMSGADFSSFENVGDAILELHKIIDWGEQSEKGLLIFVDEAECFLQERTFPDTHPRSVQLTNAYLSRVEKPSSKKIMWVFATNNRGVLDVAVESRIGKALEFALPDENGRKAIFFKYIEKYLDNEGIDVDSRINSNYAEISKYLVGLAGRSIEEIVMEARRQARSESNTLSFDLMKYVMKRMSADLIAKTKARQNYEMARYGKKSMPEEPPAKRRKLDDESSSAMKRKADENTTSSAKRNKVA